jgi:endonuclease G
VKHTAYTLQYNELNEQPDWVAYYMTKDRLPNLVQRTDDFREDPLVSSGSATLDDYKYTGYDRGHMAPAGDFGWSQTAMSESFYLSNMSPQIHSFNAGIWEVLENQVRTWANTDGDTLFIAAGPLLKPGLPVIGARHKLTVPEYFYKAILRKSNSSLSAIGFVFKHEASSKPLSSFAVTVDSLEHLTGFNFFSRLAESVQADIESRIDYSKWPGVTLTKSQLRKAARGN